MWGRLGSSWGGVEAVLGHLGTVLGPSWGRLGAILEPSWGHLGAILGHLGRSEAILKANSEISKNAQNVKKSNVLGLPEAAKMAPKRHLSRLEATEEASWRQLGGNLAEDGQEDEVKLT